MRGGIDQDVLQHLLFHKAIAEYEDEVSRIDKYIEMLERAQTGEHLGIDDPFDKSIAIAFELVLQKHLNPWAIDLARFSSMYLQRARKEKIDLVIAGRLIHMAWRVLNLQSRDAAENAEKLRGNEGIDWDELAMNDWLYNEQDYSYTKMMSDRSFTPLIEPIRRKAERRVTLIELIEAFERARREAEERKLIEKIRETEKERIISEARKRMKGVVHEERIEVEIERVWKRIERYNGRAVPITELCNFDDKNERITTLVALLHLAHDGKIRLYQKRFPFGTIYVKKLT